ncbi:hypothetical protein Sipo8835_33560 [Streptomyces ipomoeae]|jgi:hypothetical protein|uniref:Uncharacterized protein n=1 Tax=Streptomyces ipomoeae TaxID=103232 RepID=A0AAE9AX60_9ACTN|nr:hypothetical protein [Streptomyces ipomoeae]TQE20214.1 hypothetical protein Sipo7851_42750 [Streptomyces ipomoeae]TQE24393.1 hypothetical protein Sipo8835_33560 [Streptomyces ipomoeae]
MAQQWWIIGKQRMNEVASQNGHTLTRKRLPRESKDHALVFEGTCADCGATVEIGKGWSSCATIRNARDEACSGPGTAVLTEVEEERASELFAEAVGEYVQALKDASATFTRPKAPFRDPLAAEGTCGLMSWAATPATAASTSAAPTTSTSGAATTTSEPTRRRPSSRLTRPAPTGPSGPAPHPRQALPHL